MGRSSGRNKAKQIRRKRAIESQEHLSQVLMDPSMPLLARKGAAKHLTKTSTRNRLPLPIKQRHWICRGCSMPLIPGTTARIRIRSGQRITTCLECGRVRRLGGGPKSHRRVSDD